MKVYNHFSELPGANGGTNEQLGGIQSTATDNMSNVGTLSSGHGLYIHPDDHGNPHVDVMQGKRRLAKIFMQPEIALDPSVKCRLSKDERNEAFALIKKNLNAYKMEWNRIHEHNKAAQHAIIPEETQ